MSNVIGADCETQEFSKREGITPRNAKLEGISVAYSNTDAVYETDPKKWASLLPKNGTTVVFHHAKFDLMKLKQNGLRLPKQWEDTLIAAHLVDENSSHQLKDLAKSLPFYKIAQKLNPDTEVEIKKYKDVDRENKEELAEYAKNDAIYARQLWVEKFQHELAMQDLEGVYELEKKIVPVVHQMQETGLVIDEVELTEFSKFVSEERERTKQLVFEVAGNEFGIDSPKQVAEFLYKELRLKAPKRSKKTGAPSTDKEALVALEHPVADALLEYRAIQKLETAFTNKLSSHIVNGRIYPDFNPMGPVTGRFSCSNPNVQQAPSKGELGKRFRRLFVAPKGKKLIVADYEQAELRILAHYSNDPLLIHAYTQEGADLHALTGKGIFGKDELTKEERGVAKIINFGIVYGLTPQGLFRRLPIMGIRGFSLQDCEDFIRKYFQTYRGVASFLSRVDRKIRDFGEVKSLSGRKRRLPLATPREIRQGQNFIIQGSSADLCKNAIVGIHSELPSSDCRVVGMVHDEILVEAPEEEAHLVKECMEQWIGQVPKEWCGVVGKFRVPMTTSAHVVSRWSEAK